MSWRSPVEAELTQAVVHDNPRGETESALHYIERIAILAGLMPPGRAAFTDNSQIGPQDAQVAPRRAQMVPVDLSAVRLPYREPGDEEEPWVASKASGPWEER